MSIINLYNADSLPEMKKFPKNRFDLAIVDPVYGIDGNAVRKGRHNGKLAYLNKQYHTSIWDQKPPPAEYFDELFRISKRQIIWGINYFLALYPLRIGPGRLIWDKCNQGTNYSDCEIAYCSTIESVRIFRYMWNGMMQGRSMNEGHIKRGDSSTNERRFHPTQKPKTLYSWILQTYAKPGWSIFDSHSGSGTLLRACYDLDFDCEAYEIDPVYFADNKAETERYKQQERIPFSAPIYTQSKLDFNQ